MYCKECLQECSEVTIDNSIGPYEYWGATGVHTDIRVGSDCCEAEVISDSEYQGIIEAKFESELDELYCKYDDLGLNLKDMLYQAKRFYEAIEFDYNKQEGKK